MTDHKKKMIIILCGIHFYENYIHWTKKKYNIDFRLYTKNIKNRIYNYFNNEYDIDTLISTNDSSIINQLIELYKPINFITTDENKNIKLIKILKLVLENYANDYDALVITRFDIYFLKEFINIDYDKLNIISILESDNLCDDNFFFVPKKYIITFAKLIIDNLSKQKNNNVCIHYLKNQFELNFNVNYLLNEYIIVEALTFYKLHFFNSDKINYKFILNKFDFSDNILYTLPNSSMIIENNIINFNKINNNNFCWVGYNILEPGKYNLSFEICCNKDIINFDFIKLHKPVKFFKVDNIFANTWTQIRIYIETFNNDDLLCFIFDNFNDLINIQYKNVTIEKIIKQEQIINKSGIILNNLQNDIKYYKSNDILLCINDDNSYRIIKNQTNGIIPYLWFGYNFESMYEKIKLSFDINFISEVPAISDNFYVKTHKPEKYYSEWLTLCKKNEFVNIEIILQHNKKTQLIIFIMDQFLKNTEFIIKNINFTDIILPSTSKLDFIFIHNPKTGGETIETLLKIDKNHEYARDRLVNKNIYSFVFVRNPITRLISWYNHLRKHLYFNQIISETNSLNDKSQTYNSIKNGILIKPQKHRELAEQHNIDDFICIMLTNHLEYNFPYWGPLSFQYDYVFDVDNTQLVIDIYKFENYKEELTKILIKLNKNDEIENINKTNHSINSVIKLQDDTIELIYKYFKKDFIAFNYDKNYL